MSEGRTAIIKLNPALNRWEATFQGHVLAKTTNPNPAVAQEYLRKMVEGGFSQKAKNHGVTKVVVVGAAGAAAAEDQVQVVHPEDLPSVEKEFPINERFDIMSDYVDMVAKRELASTLVTGEGGLGKTFTVMKSLKASGLRDISKMDIGARVDGKRGYIVTKGYSTAKGLYRTLYENRNQICVFDDCDSVLKDPTAVNLLKAALDSYDERVVTWNAEGFGSDEDLPRSFEFTGGVIFISNMAKGKVPQAIRSRAMCADVSMTRAEVIERMRVIIKSPEFMPEFESEHKMDALDFIDENVNNPLVVELNLRSLVNVVKARASKPESWKRLALYTLANG